uniref:Aluminum-activated malate transporter n=1 Tax=Cannabis sativa TaxID=3483 RepID=A0A803PNA2_CANSA
MIPTKVHAEVTQVKVVENVKEENNMKNMMKKVDRYPGRVWRAAVKMGKEDPRKVTHSLKVGLALTLVSLLYLLEPLFEGIGDNAIWAVMTVVVVLESTAGATLCKGLNRGFGTFIAGSLAFLIEFIANESGRVFRAVFIGTSVFLIGAITTYMRFFPNIKKNFDYGVMIFLLTFNLIAVSSYRVDNVLKIAHERFYTIAIGCGICLVMTLLIFPHWSGENLHNSTISKIEGLAKSIDACVNEYFDQIEETYDESNKDPIYEGFKAVLDSKSNDETMALHASWEPRHSRHCYKCPGQQYVKLGAALRQFGYTVAALHGCLRTQIQKKKLNKQISKITITSLEFSEALPLAAFVSLLVEAVAKLDIVINEVEELGNLACFSECVKKDGDDQYETITIKYETPRVDLDQDHLPSNRTE